MYRSILTPLDGSAFAEHALPLARSIARRANATLRLVLVHVPIEGKQVDYISSEVTVDEALDKRLKEYEQAYLNNVVENLATDMATQVTASLLDGQPGQVAETLNNFIATAGVDLVVMTTHGYGALNRLWLGSVTDWLVRHASIPILLVRSRETEEFGPNLNQEQIFQHILIPLDGSTLAEQVLEYAIELGKLMEADYTLLRVIEPMTPIDYLATPYPIQLDQQLLDQQQREAQAYLTGIAERLQAQARARDSMSLRIQTRVVIGKNPSAIILEESSKHGIDLIAMETHGYSGLTRLLIGSVADKVLRGTSVPILLHCPHDETP